MIKDDLKRGEIRGMYLFYGEETYLTEFYVREIRKATVAEGTDAFNLSLFEGGIDPDSLTDACLAAPFMAEKRLVIIKNTDLSPVRDELERLIIKKLSGVTLLIVYTIEYKPDARTKLHKAIAAHGQIEEFKRQSSENLVPWIKRRFKAQGKEIDSQNAQFLLFYSGYLMNPLCSEIEKISAFASGENIERRHIEAVATPTTEAIVFDMTDALMERRHADALAILQKLLDYREEPVVVLGAIGSQMRGIYLAKTHANRPDSRNVIMKTLGYRSTYPADKLIKASSRTTLDRCRRAVTDCLTADSDLKSGADKNAVLETLILKLAC